MRKFRKTIAVLCSALLLAQGVALPNWISSQAKAADTGVNFQTMQQYGLDSNSYFWKKGIWNRTTSSYARDVVTRPYPRLIGNQWNVYQNGLENNGDTNKYQQYAAQYFDFIYLNRVQGAYSDKFVDTIDATHNPSMGLLKYRNGVYAKADALGRRCYVLPYHAQEGVEIYSPPNTGYNYWFHDNADNPWKTSQNLSTWDLVNQHNGWYKNSSGSYVQYGSYSTSQRRIFDQRIAAMQQYWAGHAYGASIGDGTTQFDGIFADNWLRSNGPDSTGWRRGVNQAAGLLKSKWHGDKILVGNGLQIGEYNARDFGMIEDFSGNMKWDFASSDAFANANQLTIDSSANSSWGSLWNRLARNLMTDDVFGIHDDENGGVVSFVDNYISKLGKVGYPMEDRVNLGNSVFKRKFTNGIAYWNGSSGTATVNVPAGLYKNINGTNVEGNMSLASHAGIVLKTRVGTPGGGTPPPTASVPKAPSSLAVDGVTKGATTGEYYVNLKWTDNSTDETGFKLYQSVGSESNFQESKTPGANTTSYSTNLGTNPTPGTYYYKLTAVNSAGESQASNIVNAQVESSTTPPPTTNGPAAPSNLTVTGVTKGATSGTVYVNLKWTDNSSDETGFKLYQSVGSESNYQAIKTPAVNTTTYGINLGTTPTAGIYYYKITAVNASGESQPSNVVNTQIGTTTPPPATTKPAAPTGVTATSSTSSTGDYVVDIKWADNSNNETGFKVLQSLNSTTSYQQAATSGANTTSAQVNLGKTPTFGTYNYQVVSVNSVGQSAVSNTASVKLTNPVPAAPSSLTLTSITKGATSGNYYVNLKWADNSNNETGFQILQSINSTSNFQVVKTPAANTTTYGINLGATPTKGTYYYKIVALNSYGKSSESNVITATVK